MDNYKIAFIHGNQFEERNLIDGQIAYYGNIEEKPLHVIELLNYAKTTFPDIPVFNSLNEKHQPEVVSYFLTKLGMIVFLNMTRYDEAHLKKYGRSGMLLLPDELTENQKESLKKFAETIPNYSVSINYSLNIDTGILDGKTIQGFNGETPSEIINVYLKRTNKMEASK